MTLHMFFESLGSDEIKRRGLEEDKPLRMAKTLLHELCKRVVRPRLPKTDLTRLLYRVYCY